MGDEFSPIFRLLRRAARHACLLILEMAILLKIKRRDFFNKTAFLFWCHALSTLGSSNCCVFEMRHATGEETCTKIYVLFIFNLV